MRSEGPMPPTNPVPTPGHASIDNPLPASMKGYELYSWEEGGELWFTLITGTNRQKALNEVKVGAVDVRAVDRVIVSAKGIDRLKQVVALVPSGTSVVVARLPGLPPVSDANRARIEEVLENHEH